MKTNNAWDSNMAPMQFNMSFLDHVRIGRKERWGAEITTMKSIEKAKEQKHGRSTKVACMHK